ncbi:MAG: T9SS type A sorting domain-containing protein [Chitinophagales bacterium]
MKILITKKLFLLSIIILGLLAEVGAQTLPFSPSYIYEFTNGSIANTAPNSDVPSLDNTPSTTTDRFGTSGNAANIGGSFGASLTSILATENLNTSISFWIKSNAVSSFERVLDMFGPNGKGYYVGFNSSTLSVYATAETDLSFSASKGFNAPYSSLGDSTWHHIVITSRQYLFGNNDQLYFDLYIDGVMQTLSNPGSSLNPAGDIDEFLINAELTIDPGNNYNGDLDDIYFYKKRLSQAEVTQLYNHTSGTRPTKYYVDADALGNNDGSSWTNALTDLREAFLNSYDGMEIWVAEGTYKRTGTNRDFSFAWLTDSLKVYGGFNGTETMLSQRDWNANETILSGDIGVVGDNSDNCYTTLLGPLGSSTNTINYSLIDGFIVQDGNANGSTYYERRQGGGFFSYYYVRNTDVKNCTFKNNYAQYGGAISAAAFQQEKTVNFENCIIQENSNEFASIFIGVYNGNNTTSTISNCLVVNNTANSPTAGTNQMTSMYVNAQAGGSIDLDINNSTFAENTNSYSGSNDVASILVYTQNTAGTQNVDINNSIFWGNTDDDEIVRLHSTGAVFTNVSLNSSISDLTSTESFYTETNVSNSDPLFTDALNEDYTLQSTSPAIDAGSQTGLIIPSLDLAGNARVIGSEIDMGCYENQCNVSVNVSNVGDDLNATTGFATYQWLQDGTAISGATNAIYTPTTSGDYSCEITDNGCSATSNTLKIDMTTIGINDISFENVSVYPNPTNGIINLNVSETLSSVRIMDLTGKTVQVFNAGSKQLDISEFTIGIYFLEIANAERKSVVKIIKK